MVTIGAQHAIALLARALIGRGDRALIEAPTYPHAYEALRAAGARLVTVPVEPRDGGADGFGAVDEVDALTRAIRHSNPVAAYLMPDFQNPTGRSLGAEGRERVLDAAARQGTIMIADETTAELDIDRGLDLAPLAAYGPAVMIGSVGKTVWGGIRVGWIRAERPLLRRLLAVRSPNDLGTPILEQLMVTRLMGRMDDILELRREQLRAGRDRLESLLADAFPDWHVPHVDGGIVTWVGLGAPVSSQLALAARSQGLIIAAGPRFGIDGAFERFLRLPICYSAETTDAAVQALSRAWGALARTPVPADQGALGAVV
jgi:DNA-binding transcriptional MocR family regulator